MDYPHYSVLLSESIEALKGQIPDSSYAKILALRNDRKQSRFPRQVASCYNGRMLPIAGFKARGYRWRALSGWWKFRFHTTKIFGEYGL